MDTSSRSSKVLIDDKEKIFGEGNEDIQSFGKMMKKHAQKVIDANNISNCSAEELAKCKFTFLEPSPAEAMLEQLQKKGEQFVDQSFPANKKSLDGNFPYADKNMAILWPKIQWRKISEVLPQSKIFKGDIEPNDIQQGILGDCYFLAALSALAERQHRIFNLFLLKEVNNVKYYSVRILFRGKWMTIDLDEYIPWLNAPQYDLANRPAFAKTSQNQLWVILLEKAYAKLYGSYIRINEGIPLEALQALTGGNPVVLNFRSNQQIQNNWKYLEEATRLHYPMIAATRGKGETIGNNGIVAGHAYTLLSVQTINGNERVVKLRNPWGDQEWQGKWSDVDNKSWNQVSQSQKNRVGFKKAMDGIFFMPYSEFIKCFSHVELVEMDDNYSHVYKSMAGNYPQGVYFKIKILKQGKYSIQNYTTPNRKLYPPGKIPSNLSTCHSKILHRLSDREKFYQDVKHGCFMNYTTYTLSPGQYIYHVLQNFYQNDKKREINVAIYSEYAAEIKIANSEDVSTVQKCNSDWNPPQLQEQYKADQQAKKQSKDTGLTSKEADKLAALNRFKNMGGKGQADKEEVAPPKKNQDEGNNNKLNQDGLQFIEEKQTIQTCVGLLGQQLIVKKITRYFRNKHGNVVSDVATQVTPKQPITHNIGWSIKYRKQIA